GAENEVDPPCPGCAGDGDCGAVPAGGGAAAGGQPGICAGVRRSGPDLRRSGRADAPVGAAVESAGSDGCQSGIGAGGGGRSASGSDASSIQWEIRRARGAAAGDRSAKNGSGSTGTAGGAGPRQ